jgi:hypothetical protein
MSKDSDTDGRDADVMTKIEIGAGIVRFRVSLILPSDLCELQNPPEFFVVFKVSLSFS